MLRSGGYQPSFKLGTPLLLPLFSLNPSAKIVHLSGVREGAGETAFSLSPFFRDLSLPCHIAGNSPTPPPPHHQVDVDSGGGGRQRRWSNNNCGSSGSCTVLPTFLEISGKYLHYCILYASSAGTIIKIRDNVQSIGTSTFKRHARLAIFFVYQLMPVGNTVLAHAQVFRKPRCRPPPRFPRPAAMTTDGRKEKFLCLSSLRRAGKAFF